MPESLRKGVAVFLRFESISRRDAECAEKSSTRGIARGKPHRENGSPAARARNDFLSGRYSLIIKELPCHSGFFLRLR